MELEYFFSSKKFSRTTVKKLFNNKIFSDSCPQKSVVEIITISEKEEEVKYFIERRNSCGKTIGAEFLEDGKPTLKLCHVLLNRNLPFSHETVIENNLSDVDIKEEVPEISGENNYNLIKGQKVKYIKSENSAVESSDSEFSDDENSSEVEETSQSEFSEDVKPMLKTCSVLLNRILPDSSKILKVNNPPYVVMKKEVSDGNYYSLSKEEKDKCINDIQNMCVETSDSELSNDGNNYKLRKKDEKVKYFDGSQNLCGETSHSEFSENDSCSSDVEEMVQEEVRKKRKHKLLEIEELKKPSCLHCDKSVCNHSASVINKHSLLSKRFKCSLCSMGWKDRQSFIIHMKRCHPEVEPFLCEYRSCDQSFKTQNLLKMHSKMHFRYMCRFCKKLFAMKHNMRKHVLKTH